jgi:O-antigen ligase
VTDRSRFLLFGAAVVGPLALFPVLLIRPELGLAAAAAVIFIALAARSVALPVAMAGLPDIIIGLKGSSPFPPKISIYLITGWILIALFIALLRDGAVLPFGTLGSGPVLLTLGLVGLMLVRLGASEVPAYGSYKLQLFVAKAVIALFAGIVIAKGRKHFDLWLVVMLVFAALSGMTLIRQILAGTADASTGGRLALFQDASPIQLGRAAAYGLLVGIYLLVAGGPFWRKLVALVSVPVLAVTLLAAGSRGPTLSIVVGLVVLFALTMSEPGARRRLVLVAVGLVAAAILVGQLVPGQDLNRSLSILLGGDTAGHGGLDANGRFALFSAGWNLFTSHPFLGIGTGSFAAISPELYPHNILLEVGVEYGILGVALIVGILFLGFRASLRAWRVGTGADRSRAALVVALLAAAVTNAFVSGGLESSSEVWLAVGLGAGLTDSPGRLALALPFLRGRRRAERVAEPLNLSAGFRGSSSSGSGAILSPASGSLVRDVVRITATPAETGWSTSSLAIECSPDGREWVEVAEAAADDAYDLFLVSRTAGARRRHVAVVQTRERAEQLKQALEAEHEGGPEQVELAPSRRKPWTTGESHGALWDTSELADGLYRLRAVTTDVASHRVRSPEVTATVDNSPPVVALDSPVTGAAVTGTVELAATARDHVSGVAGVRFELEHGSEWREIATVLDEPYVVAWDTGSLPTGEYRVRAVATDPAGNVGESMAAKLRVAGAVAGEPAIVEEPIALEVLPTALTDEVELCARVGNALVDWVAFQVKLADDADWHTVDQLDEPPFALELDTRQLRDGVYEFRIAASRRGQVDHSHPVRLSPAEGVPERWPVNGSNGSVNGAVPSALRVWLLEPAPGATVTGQSRLAAGTDTPDGITFVRFECSADGQVWWPLGSLARAPYLLDWDTPSVPDGSYWLRCVADDSDWRTSQSAPVQVRVANASPLMAPPAYSAGTTSPEPDRTIGQLERLLEQTAHDDPRRVERIALIDVLRGVAGPDGRVPDHFAYLVAETFGP